jgi:uncharacterized membrane protein YdbT with pleckstrin-like domain
MADRYLESMLGESEHIVFVTRQHWLVLLGQILGKAVLALGLAVLVTLIWRIWLPGSLVPLAYLLLILPLLGVLENANTWASRRYIITNRRVIKISGVFSKQVSDTSLNKVSDVKLEQSFWGRLMDYGDLEIMTASELGIDRIPYIAQPVRFKTAMLDAEERSARSQAGLGQRSEAEIAGPIEQLSVLRDQGLLTEEEFQQKKAQVLARLQPADQPRDEVVR